MTKETFFILDNGQEASLYTISNSVISAKISNFGGVIYSIEAPNKQGSTTNCVLGFKNLKDYQNNSCYFGALVGRYANRIANAKFTLEGVEYQLTANNNGNALHGGDEFNKALWEVLEHTENSLTLRHYSLDMSFGYPGNLDVIVKYSITKDNGLQIDYKATTDKTTVVNLTNHSYFSLDDDETIDNTEIQLNADNFTETNEFLIPTGKIINVENTPYDLRTSKKFGDLFNNIEGYDDNFIINKGYSDLTKPVATLYSENSGIELNYYTTTIGVQVYTGNFLAADTTILANGKLAKKHGACCLESQSYPDSPNHDNFPTTVLHPDEVYTQTTIYKFKVR